MTALRPRQWLPCFQSPRRAHSPKSSVARLCLHIPRSLRSCPALLSSLEFLKVRCIFPPHSPLPPASPFLPSLPLVLCMPGSFSFPRSRFQGRFPQRPRLTIVSKIAPLPNYPLSRHLGSRLVIFTAHNYLLFTVCLFMASLPQRGASRTKAGIRHRRALIFACSSRKADAEARIQVPAV